MTEDRVPVTVKSLEKGISDAHKTMFFFTSYCIKCFCRLEISQCSSKYLNNHQSFARLQSFSPRPLNWKERRFAVTVQKPRGQNSKQHSFA